MKRGSKKNKFKIRYARILKCLLFLTIVGLFIYHVFTMRLTNIYITGNKYLKDQEIIELASLENYPKMLKVNKDETINKLKKANEIIDVKVKKRNTTITIEIEEAKPLYYDSLSTKIVLSNGKSTDKKYTLPILVNLVPDEIREKFIKCLSEVNAEVLVKISEIKYDPNVDTERFLLTMNDGNYVYINLKRFNLVNNYLTIISNFKDEKGIIYLDSGSHFEIFKKS